MGLPDHSDPKLSPLERRSNGVLPTLDEFMTRPRDSNLVWKDETGRLDASRCYNCGGTATIAIGGPFVGPVASVCDTHTGVLQPLLQASLARLNRGRPWPRPQGRIRINLDLVAY